MATTRRHNTQADHGWRKTLLATFEPPVPASSWRQSDSFMTTPQADFQLIRMLSDRLERISVDSVWAHRASGVRGALLRHLELHERNLPSQAAQLNVLIVTAFHILEEAAHKRIS